MKYQSEIVNEILEQRGHEKSSLHYESECIQTWIDENKGSYPKLCDYQSEWLNYINENPIGVFPYETLTDVTEATVNNVVPYSYKSAILTGQTLNNLADLSQLSTQNFAITRNNNEIILSRPEQYFGYPSFKIAIPNGSADKKYTVIYKCKVNQELHTFGIGFTRNSLSLAYEDGYNQNTFTPTTSYKTYSFISSGDACLGFSSRWRNYPDDGTIIYFKDIIVIEGEYDVNNMDIPYFEGMQSVKMPVLTTTGKNLISTNVYNAMSNYSNWVNLGNNSYPYFTFTGLKPNTNYTFSRENDGYIFLENDGGHCRFGNDWLYHKTKPSLCKKRAIANSGATGSINLYFAQCTSAYNLNIFMKNLGTIQLEEGSTATPYEPYKSNILTVNDDVTLRGIGDVRDELDCLTGELTERIGKIVLDGSEDWAYTSDWVKGETIGFYLLNNKSNGFCLSDKFVSYLGISSVDYECIAFPKNAWIGIRIKIDKLETQDVKGFKKYLSTNNMVIQYGLNEEVIKTVDLTITDQNGNSLNKIRPIEGTMHIKTDGTPIKPTFTGEIPVEAITQNLASFIEE